MIFIEGIKRRGNLEIGDRDNPPLPIFAETCWFSWTEQKFPLDRSISSLCFVEGRKWSIRQNRGKQQGFVGGEEETLSREIPPWLDTRRRKSERKERNLRIGKREREIRVSNTRSDAPVKGRERRRRKCISPRPSKWRNGATLVREISNN